MGRTPCCNGEHAGLKKGPWTHEEDQRLKSFLLNNPHTSWREVPPNAGLLRCGKSCRLRWMNYLRPNIRRGNFTAEEENLIIQLHASVGNKWSVIASQLPGRTDNEIKNLWNTRLRKMLVLKGINPINHQPMCNPLLSDYVKNFIKSIESMIIAGLMTQSSSSSSSSVTTATDNADISSTFLPSLVTLPLQPSSLEELLTQFCQIDSSPDHSISNNNSWVKGNSTNDGNSYDKSMLNEADCLSNDLGQYLGDEFENTSGPFLTGGIDLVSPSAPSSAGEEGFQYSV